MNNDTPLDYSARYLQGAGEVLTRIPAEQLEAMVAALVEVRTRGGRVFFLGVGGGAGHASHAVNDFRKIAGIECYAPSDNVSELTARINDDGWDTCYANWLRVSRLAARDAVFVFSVGGGSVERNISMNLVNSLRLARERGACILGIVGRDGGATAQLADIALVIPTVADEMVTALVESFQAVVWHLLVSHPLLRQSEMKWESTAATVATAPAGPMVLPLDRPGYAPAMAKKLPMPMAIATRSHTPPPAQA
jgi:D-sedoheptulose 7-phosphate isomerase